MWALSKRALLSFLTSIIPGLIFAQQCPCNVTGSVKDMSTGIPISNAHIYVKEASLKDVTDSLGQFAIGAICKGNYHLAISHVGCESQELFLSISGDTSILIFLDHHGQLLNEVAILDQGESAATQQSHSLHADHMAQYSNKNLATMLEDISGVRTLKNGSGIAKPVVHGLYGNRLTILNNGIAQGGQQWGADHSPEIDPLLANKITVIKGVSALEYMGNSLGSVVLVEPKRIGKEPHLHGEGRYFFESNGLGNGLHLALQQSHKSFAWQAVGTLKKSGDKRTADYFLRNTGNEEAHLALQVEKSWSKKWLSRLYFSSFNANFGVLRGSHIGNLTDLKSALERDVPFYTKDKFSYTIGAPYQKVNHHLLKLQTKYSKGDKESLDISYAQQINLRKEFDVRRSGRSDMPAMSLRQVSSFLEAKYRRALAHHWSFKSGVQLNRVDNSNLPETGILPLIPNYLTYEYGAFGMATKSMKRTTIQIGGRYDFEQRKVAAISNGVPRRVIRHEKEYQAMSAMGGMRHEFNKAWNMSYNLGFATRNPEVNELYSNGLHQGVSGIEEGDPELNKEVSLKHTWSLKGDVKGKLFFEGLFYYQNIDDYIFINPQDEVRLTIRGAFPVFKYEQTDARLMGFDVTATYQASERMYFKGSYSYLDGYDRKYQMPLVYMPSNHLKGSFNYQIPSLGKFHNVEFQVNSRYVFEQTNLLPSQDFVAPPAGYHLLGLKISAERQLRKLRLVSFIRMENLGNVAYRDYLNRQRYFADDLGFNLVAGFNLKF